MSYKIKKIVEVEKEIELDLEDIASILKEEFKKQFKSKEDWYENEIIYEKTDDEMEEIRKATDNEIKLHDSLLEVIKYLEN